MTLCAPEEKAVPFPLETPVVFLYFDVQNDFITLLIDENAP
jgi:hypothetical protein